MREHSRGRRSLQLAIASLATVLGLMLFGAERLSAEDVSLRQLWEKLSDGDRSAIRAASGKVDAAMMSVKGSANVRFWQELDERGLLRRIALPELYGDAADTLDAAGMVAYAVTPKGAEELPALVEGLEKR
jgi:hypothetical protein